MQLFRAAFLVILDSALLADILWYGVLVDEEVHRLGNDEVLRHVPCALVCTCLAP